MRCTTALLISAMAFLQAASSLHWDEFDHTVQDGEDDIIEISFAEYRVYLEKGKDYLDIKEVSSSLVNDSVQVALTVHGDVLDSDMVTYEVMLTIYDVSSRYGEPDILLNYTGGRSSMEDLSKGIIGNITGNTSVLDRTIVFSVPRDLFDAADMFEMEAVATESSPDEMAVYMDATYPIEWGARERPSRYYVYYFLAVITLATVAVVLLAARWRNIARIKRKRRTELCPLCRGLIRDGDDRCYHCGAKVQR